VFPKVQAATDIGALQGLLVELIGDEVQAARNLALQAVAALSANPTIAVGVAREELLKRALALFDDEECPGM